jgi:hypothetical protein
MKILISALYGTYFSYKKRKRDTGTFTVTPCIPVPLPVNYSILDYFEMRVLRQQAEKKQKNSGTSTCGLKKAIFLQNQSRSLDSLMRAAGELQGARNCYSILVETGEVNLM